MLFCYGALKVLGFIASLFIVWFFLSLPGHTHSADRPDLNNWFMHLRSKGGAMCCDMTEAERLTDVEWDTKDGHYRVFIDSEWFDVPDDSVILDPNRVGQAMVWPQRYDGKVIFIRCFIPGAGT